MRRGRVATVVAGAAVAISLGLTTAAIVPASEGPSTILAQTKAKERAKPAPKPAQTLTGACTVTAYGISPMCTGGLTFDDCQRVASKVKGVARWEEGKPCKE